MTTGVYLFLVSLVYVCIQAQFYEGDYINDYSMHYMSDNDEDVNKINLQKPEIIRLQSGTDLVLKCNITSTSCRNYKHKIMWQFKTCQWDLKKVPCSNFYDTNNKEHAKRNSSWNKITSHAIRKKCFANLELKSVNETHNGLYRCTNGSQTIKVYEVEVIDSLTKYIGQPPELLDVIPSNITIAQDMQVIIQCKVYSKQPPIILWFKQCEEDNYDIQYSDHFYKRINTSVQVYALPHELNVYLSKLNIYQASEADSGVYVCVAMTESGKDYKDAVVNVITKGNYLEPHTPLFLLFLIPVIFALLPISVWLCYYRKRRKNDKNKIIGANDTNLTRPIISNRSVANETELM